MIKCEPDDYKDKFYNDLNQEASATDISRDGYICFYRTITKKENKDKDGNIVGYSLE